MIAELSAVSARVEPAFVQQVRLRARRRALWLRYLWGSDEDLGTGARVHAELDRNLLDPARMRATELHFRECDSAAQALGAEIEMADEAAAAEPAWARLAHALDLPPADVNLLALVVAPEIDPRLSQVYGYLLDDARPTLPTKALAAGLFDWSAEEALTAGDGLRRWYLAQPVEGRPASPDAGWVADPAAARWLVRGEPHDEECGVALTTFDAHQAECSPRLYPAELSTACDFVRRVAGWPAPRAGGAMLQLVGDTGSGRATLAAQLVAQFGLRLLIVDAANLDLARVTPERALELVARVCRIAKLVGAAVHVRNAEVVPSHLWAHFLARTALLSYGAQAPLLPPPSSTTPYLSLTLPRLGPDAPPEVLRRRRPAADIDELLSPLPCPYVWNEIVLQPALEEHLREFEAQAHLRAEVYDDWGFGRLVPLGRGISALFAGPSGTGKTMAAQVLARSLHVDLFRIDLAGVVNKYIGETEKRLKRVFDACERSGAILLFDEADALFGRRTQVRDAHDRYANIEIDYLLQRMERFDGVAILATNRKEDIDRAFLRRLRFVIDFLRPGPVERLAIWRLALPQQSPSGEPLLDAVDFDKLADRLALTGAAIKSAALAAAFSARSESRRIGMPHLLAAARREMIKQGAQFRDDTWGAPG